MGIHSSNDKSESVLDASRERVVYEVGGSPRSFLEALERALVDGEVRHHFDIDGDLVVYADDEDITEAIFEALPEIDEDLGSDVEDDGVDGLAAVVQMTAMWHAVGTLEEDPESAEATLAAAKAADALEKLDLPYGFERPEWNRIVSLSSKLRDELDSDDESAWGDEEIIAASADLRAKLQKYV